MRVDDASVRGIFLDVDLPVGEVGGLFDLVEHIGAIKSASGARAPTQHPKRLPAVTRMTGPMTALSCPERGAPDILYVRPEVRAPATHLAAGTPLPPPVKPLFDLDASELDHLGPSGHIPSHECPERVERKRVAIGVRRRQLPLHVVQARHLFDCVGHGLEDRL